MVSKQRGFTLIETLVAIAISAMLLAALASYSLAYMFISREGEVMHRLQRELVFSLEALESEIRVAEDITPAGAGAWTIQQITYNEGYGSRGIAVNHDPATMTLTLGNRVLSQNVAAFEITTPVADRPEHVLLHMETVGSLPMVQAGNLPLVLEAEVVMRNHGFTPPTGDPEDPDPEEPEEPEDPGEPEELVFTLGDPPWSSPGSPDYGASTYSVLIEWTTSIDCTSRLEWGETGKPTTTVDIGAPSTSHSYPLSGLKYKTGYAISVSVRDPVWNQTAGSSRSFNVNKR